MAIVPARIDASGKVVTNDRKLKVSKKNQEQIQWIAEDDGGPWTVVFLAASSPGASATAVQTPTTYHGSPFSESTFDVPQAGNVRSGVAVVAASATEYKYEV